MNRRTLFTTLAGVATLPALGSVTATARRVPALADATQAMPKGLGATDPRGFPFFIDMSVSPQRLVFYHPTTYEPLAWVATDETLTMERLKQLKWKVSYS